MDIHYKSGATFTVAEMIDLYRRSTLGKRRPLDRPDIFGQMRDNANLVVTAWDGDKLVGIARSLTELQGGEFRLAVDGDLFKAEVILPQAN